MMIRSLTWLSAIPVIALIGVSIPTPSRAQQITFFCGSSQGFPATMAKTSQGNVPIVRWISGHFTKSGWTPQKRCLEVSDRFQYYHDTNALAFITTGTMNRQPVICTAKAKGSSCNGLLFTLKPGTDPALTLQRLMNVRSLGSAPLNESSTGSNVYVDVKDLLNNPPPAQ
jgi:hypothetical protein